jgi:hypothetical protein
MRLGNGGSWQRVAWVSQVDSALEGLDPHGRLRVELSGGNVHDCAVG